MKKVKKGKRVKYAENQACKAVQTLKLKKIDWSLNLKGEKIGKPVEEEEIFPFPAPPSWESASGNGDARPRTGAAA